MARAVAPKFLYLLVFHRVWKVERAIPLVAGQAGFLPRSCVANQCVSKKSGAGDPAGGGTSRIFTTQLRGDADDPAVRGKRPATTLCRFRMLQQVLRCSFPENAVHHVL